MSITARSARGPWHLVGRHGERARSNDSRTASSAYCQASPSFWTKPCRNATVEAAPPSVSSIAPAIGAAWMNDVRSVRNVPISSSGLIPPRAGGTASGRAGRRTSPRCSSDRPTGLRIHRPLAAELREPSARVPVRRRRCPRATRRRSIISSSAPASPASRSRRRVATVRPASRSSRRRSSGPMSSPSRLPTSGNAYVAGSPSVNVTSTSAKRPAARRDRRPGSGSCAAIVVAAIRRPFAPNHRWRTRKRGSARSTASFEGSASASSHVPVVSSVGTGEAASSSSRSSGWSRNQK